MEERSSDGEPGKAPIPNDDPLKARWKEVAERKSEAYAICCRIRKAKIEVDQARQERDAADNNFMSTLRPTQAGLMSLRTIASTLILHSQFERMQRARDAYQQLEMGMFNLQDSFMEIQDELELLESHLINDLRPLARDNTNRSKLEVQIPEQPQSELLKGLEIEPANISDPLYQRLLSALGSLGIARRRRVDVLARKARLEEQKRLLIIFEKYHPAALRYIAPLETGDYDFLNQFEMQERRISGHMEAWRREVERLARLCWGSNLIAHYNSLEYVLSWYPDDFSIDTDLDHDQVEAASTEPTEFPILLSNPSNLLEDFPVTAEVSLKQATSIPEGDPRRAAAIASAAKELTIQNLLSDANDTPNFINRWLLQNLRTSRLQVGALYSSYLASGHSGIFDIETWQWDVLSEWWEDEDHMRSLQYFRPPETSWASASPSPPSWMSEAVRYTWDSDVSDFKFDMTELEQPVDICETGSQE